MKKASISFSSDGVGCVQKCFTLFLLACLYLFSCAIVLLPIKRATHCSHRTNAHRHYHPPFTKHHLRHLRTMSSTPYAINPAAPSETTGSHNPSADSPQTWLIAVSVIVGVILIVLLVWQAVIISRRDHSEKERYNQALLATTVTTEPALEEAPIVQQPVSYCQMSQQPLSFVC